MEQQFDFNNIGKKMPYTVPEEFFDTLEQKVMEEVQQHPASTPQPAQHRPRILHLRVLLTAAAVLALLVVATFTFLHEDKVDAASVEQAFTELSHDDQAYLLAVYQNDVFINGQE